MADIRKRTGKKGTTYQVRYADESAASGYSFKTFRTRKEAQQFRESDKKPAAAADTLSVAAAVDLWLRVCKTEGRDGRAPVSEGTYSFYSYIAGVMKGYQWKGGVQSLTKPDIVAFRSWLVAEHGRYVASRSLTYFHGVLAEMQTRGEVAANVATGVRVMQETRYDEPMKIPTPDEIALLLSAADDLAASKNEQTAKTWLRFQPMLYLAVDSGMRPQEHVALARRGLTEYGAYVEQAIDRAGKLSVPKTAAARRFIELSEVSLDMLHRYVRDHSPANNFDLVFPTATGQWQSLDNWRKRCFVAACMHAGLTETVIVDGKEVLKPRYSPYDLRHYFASMLIAEGTDIAKIKTLMGHTDISTTYDVYAHLIRRAEDAKSRRRGLIASSTVRADTSRPVADPVADPANALI